MPERTGLITIKGRPLTLIGNEVKVGDLAPDFEALANDMSPVRFSAFRGRPLMVIKPVLSGIRVSPG